MAMNYAPLLPAGGARSVVPNASSIQMVGPSPRVLPASMAGTLPAAVQARAQGSAGDLDILQFSASTYYVKEDAGAVEVKVIRIGNLSQRCSVSYRSHDRSAIAGQKYHSVEGSIDFEPGETTKFFEVGVIDDDSFDTTLEFELELFDEHNCDVSSEFRRARVLIIDDDQFPSNQFAKEIEAGEDAALHKVGFSLLWAYVRFCFWHVPGTWWKTVLIMVLTIFPNACYFMSIIIRQYLVDACLNDDYPTEHLLVPNNRKSTAMLLALAWVLPSMLLMGIDYFEMAILEVAFHIRNFLRVNLFRKYLNYTDEARAQVPIQDLKTSVMEDIPELVESGYIILFEIWRSLGKILVVLFYLLQKHPRSAGPVFVYPIIFCTWMSFNYTKRLTLLSKQGEAESDTQGCLIHADNAHRVITDYRQRGFVVRQFEELLLGQRELAMKIKHFNFWNNQVLPLVSLAFVFYQVGLVSDQVIDGSMSLGRFLATLNVYKDLGDKWEGIYSCLVDLIKVIDPLSGITSQINLPTDMPMEMERYRGRDAYVRDFLSSTPPPRNGTSVFDMIPIKVQDVTLDRGDIPNPKPFNVIVPQGTVVRIMGTHDTGKSTILRLLTDNLPYPGNGHVFVPLHLRVRHVTYAPVLIAELGVLGNLTFGACGDEAENVDRVRRIMQLFRLDKGLLRKEFDKDVQARNKALKAKAEKELRSGSDSDHSGADADDEEALIGKESDAEAEDAEAKGEEEDELSWQEKLSASEKKRLNIARAFVCNPEVLAMQRPVDELDEQFVPTLLQTFRRFVDDRGIEVDPRSISRRRPRTLFFSANKIPQNAVSDVVWSIGPDYSVTVQNGRA
eukprot:TRINITY_DN32120_c0_g1_i1.p1 TRINITY_DN32120_c0_g1~~TRINITY_DN32120_c0_g1_i1.p1  ORF type:complete len:842 (+),score=208.30 TRINITY_DN32120_c0_g1_i1:148-2673(+)